MCLCVYGYVFPDLSLPNFFFEANVYVSNPQTGEKLKVLIIEHIDEI